MPTESGFWAALHEAPFFRAVSSAIEQPDSRTAVSGLVDEARALVMSLLVQHSRRGVFMVVPDEHALESYRRGLTTFARLTGGDPDKIVALPALESDPYDGIAPHPEVIRERVVALGRLLDGDVDILLTPARALLNPLPTPKVWQSWSRRIRTEDQLPPDDFVLEALELGYRRVDTVSGPGEISRRGGIVDLFPPQSPEPVRIELFGDTVESLRLFDTANQRSTGTLDEVTLGPASENPPTQASIARVQRYLEQGLGQATGEARTARQFREFLELLQNHGYWPGFEALAGLAADPWATPFDYAGDRLLVVDEPGKSSQELARAARELTVSYEQSANRMLPAPDQLFGNPVEIDAWLSQAPLTLHELIGQEPEGAQRIEVACRSARSYSGRVPDLVSDLRKAAESGTRTLCLMRARGSAQRLMEIFGEYELEAAQVDLEATAQPSPGSSPASTFPTRGGLYVGLGALRTGFEFQDFGISVLAERGIFGEQRKAATRKSKSRAAFLSDFRDLKKNDVVVHVDHGIARYVGLGRPKGGSLNRDFMVLAFSGGDKLFVPVDRLDLVQKYRGVGDTKPTLDRLGGPGWERVKAKVRKNVESIAKELLELYARRKAATGHAFSADTPWQTELEDAFPFELTTDQKRALDEIKNDMSTSRAMDRLLVGDVGFGKTELAVRAAFKAVMDGRQVALLAPTTVLAMQHLKTFQRRYAPFPVRVDMVSRFRSTAEIKSTLNDLMLGSVDVVIGTHRLLSKDVEFKQLGLLVVDEEQRFGVTHKERLKKLAIGVDVLSMTATPIPRTLQMSLAGVRDLSVIETPPPGRSAIQTYLVPFRKNLLAQAVRQELRREGQVFVVHNRIETLPSLTRAITEMVPEARVVAVHGRMGERVLERAMLDFVERRADVLVTTTIIENGLDIPRANTIIVNRADRFGLAQLYQLRGRVGRSREHAYAYFVIPSQHTLTDVAQKRLRALQEFSDLGAGFRLAAADLEIRGAGELLGARQSGHIGSLGFDLYCQMLERAVQELQGEQVLEPRPVSLSLGIDVKIPHSYLPESGDRLVLYKRLAQARTAADIEQLQAETEDRFGHLPQAASHLFAVGRLRVVAEESGIKSIDLAEGKLQIRFHDRPPIEPRRLLEVLDREGGSFRPSGMLIVPARGSGMERIEHVRDLLHKILGQQPESTVQ